MIENKRYPHIKRGWIKAIKAIRNGGGIQKRIYLVEHPQGLDASQKTSEDCLGRRRLHQPSRPATLDAARFYKQSDWVGQEYEEQLCRHSASANNGCEQTTTGRQNRCVWNLAAPGFSSSSSSDRLTEEQENEIAENIYDWWISGKSYKQWYVEKFQQMKLDFGEF